MTLEFGLGLVTCERVPGDPRPVEELYAEALELAVVAERAGFDAVWVSEHHFLDDGYLPSVLALCAAIAARTERIRVGTGLLLAPLHDPLRVAEDAAVVDLLSRGRLVLGLGLGWREEEFEGFGVPLAERVPRLERMVSVLRGAWGDGLVAREPGLPAVAVTPKPARPGGPPIWIGAMSEPAIRRAGRLGDGLLAGEVTPGSFREQVAWALEERERAGLSREGFALGLHAPTFAWAGGDAWERVREAYHYVWWKYLDMEGARARTGPPPAKPPLTPEVEARLRAEALVGRPDEVAEGIEAYRQAAGGRLHFVARLYWPGMDPGLQREAVAAFAEEVMPRLR